VRFSSTRSSAALRAQAQLADLVEEQYALVRRAKQAELVGERAGERALLVAREARCRHLVGDSAQFTATNGRLRRAL
jgi:hypothetical protein